MSIVVVAELENRRDANAVAKFIRSLKKEAKIVKASSWEDLYLAKMIDEGMKEKGEIPVEKIHQKLRR